VGGVFILTSGNFFGTDPWLFSSGTLGLTFSTFLHSKYELGFFSFISA